MLDVAGLRVDGLGPIALALTAGECMVLAGPSGSGKSRLLRAIADLDVHEGRVACEGIPAGQVPPATWRRRVGMLAAESRWWRERVAEHFAGPPSPQDLAALDLAPALLDTTVDRLSSGERQRLALLRLMGNGPRVLLLDEPTANLDPDNVRRVEALVCGYLQARGAAALWVSHDPDQAARVGRRTARLTAGRLEDGAP